MTEDRISKFEQLKSEIEELKIKKISNEREKERLEKELEDQKRKIKDMYGVEIEDFENAIVELQNEFDSKYEKLKLQIDECKEKLGV